MLFAEENELEAFKVLEWKQNTMTFTKGQELNVTIRAVGDKADFWFTINDGIVEKLNTSIAKFVRQHKPKSDFDGPKKSACLAQFEDDKWYRGEIHEVPQNSEQPYTIFFVDYGTIRLMKSSQLRYCYGDIGDIPRQALECRLHGVVPLQDDWTVKDLENVSGLVKDEVVKLAVAKPQRGKEPMQVTLQLVDGSFCHELMISEGWAKEPPKQNMGSSTVTEMFGEQLRKVVVTPKLGAAVKLKFVRSTEPNLFYAEWLPYSSEDADIQKTIDTEIKYLEDLTSRLKDRAPDWLPLADVKEGDMCCALSSERRTWVRAKIDKLVDKDQVRVYFLDFGDVETIPISSCRMILEEFTMQPFQAQLFQLHQVESSEETWNTVVIEEMERIYKKPFKAVIKSEFGSPIQVDLFDENTINLPRPTLVYQHLVDEGHICLVRAVA